MATYPLYSFSRRFCQIAPMRSRTDEKRSATHVAPCFSGLNTWSRMNAHAALEIARIDAQIARQRSLSAATRSPTHVSPCLSALNVGLMTFSHAHFTTFPMFRNAGAKTFRHSHITTGATTFLMIHFTRLK